MREQTVKKYVQAIYLLQGEGAARGAYIAREMGITKATVSVALKTLAEDGYIVTDQSHAVRLTAQGLLLAREAIHETVHRGKDFHRYLDKITTEVQAYRKLEEDEDLNWLRQENLTVVLEALFVLKKHYYRVRTVDLAECLDLSTSAAEEQILCLEEKGFAEKGARDCVALTRLGTKYADMFFASHAALHYRLMHEGMSELDAELHACTM